MCLPEGPGGRASLSGLPSRVSLILSVIKPDDEVVKEVGGERFARTNSRRVEELERREGIVPQGGEPSVRN